MTTDSRLSFDSSLIVDLVRSWFKLDPLLLLNLIESLSVLQFTSVFSTFRGVLLSILRVKLSFLGYLPSTPGVLLYTLGVKLSALEVLQSWRVRFT